VSLATTLVQEAMAGDHEAFMELLTPVLPDAYRLAFGLLRLPPEAEDAVQDAALKAWQSFDRFRRDSEMKPWFLTIVANECRRQRRNRWWSVVRGPTVDAPAEEPGLDVVTADLRRAIHALPHDQRVAIVVRFYLDLSFEEVGQILGVSTKAAKSRTYRALARLRLSPEVATHG
jgi:RNA polymerase sigma-70 factor (ECF subfamily)